MTRRGRWTYDSTEKAWRLDDSDWWLKYERRFMPKSAWSMCSYCWMPRTCGRWWLYRGAAPSAQVHERMPRCSHRAHLHDVMPIVERGYDEVVMKSLAAL